MSNGSPSKPPQRGGLNTSAGQYARYIIAVLSCAMAFFYNEINLKALKSEAPDKLEPKYGWVKTADDASYLRPAANYYHTGVWRDNNPGRQSYFLRTPGYGLFRYALMRTMGEERSCFYFKYVQLFLFSFSVLLLFYIALLMGLPVGYALILEELYGLSPFASGFVYYGITEGITPALMILYTWLLLKGYKSNQFYWFFLAALVLGYIGITRPVLLLYGAALPAAIWWGGAHFSFARKAFLILLTAVISLTPVSIWALRSYQIAGTWTGIYPIYYAENNSQFRPAHRAIWEFQKSYGTEGRDFHECMVPLWHATVRGDTTDAHMDSIMLACPDFVKETIGAQRLRNSYLLYRTSIVQQRVLYAHDVPMPDTIPAVEQEVIKQFNTYTAEINSQHWFWCHIIVPVKLFKTLSFHSNLSLYMWQHTWRGRWWMEAMRWFFLALHFLCCLSFIGVLLLCRDKLIRLLAGVITGVYFFYLCYFFRGLEERYTLPILPLMLTGLAICVYELRNRIGLRNQTT